MRQVYHPTTDTHEHYRAAINNDLSIYHVQSGAGIGGFFKSLLKRIIPVGKSLLKKGFEAAKPALHDMAMSGLRRVQNTLQTKYRRISSQKLSVRRMSSRRLYKEQIWCHSQS